MLFNNSPEKNKRANVIKTFSNSYFNSAKKDPQTRRSQSCSFRKNESLMSIRPGLHESKISCQWFEKFAQTQFDKGWYSEAAVCLAHCVAIIGRELMARGLIKIDWSALNLINDQIAMEEDVYNYKLDDDEKPVYTLADLTSKIEETIKMLIRSERYEAVFPLSRMIIPILEKEHEYDVLVNIYAMLETACTKAAQIKKGTLRHFGTYFRVVFYGSGHGNEEKTEWIYRMPRLTSLAEACHRMKESICVKVGHGNVEVVAEKQIDQNNLKSHVAYVQLTHVEPYFDDGREKDSDPLNYAIGTNIQRFFYQEAMVDESVSKDAPEWARISLRKIYLTVEKSFPNIAPRQKIVHRIEKVLSPLELACDNLQLKAAQIRKILDAADIKPMGAPISQESLHKLDLKGLQLNLQGAVSPSVNVGLLAYAEAFTAPAQRDRYGLDGITKLAKALQGLMTELFEALRVNDVAIGPDQQTYHQMLKESYDSISGHLKKFFSFIDDEWSTRTAPSLRIRRISNSAPYERPLPLRHSYTHETPRHGRTRSTSRRPGLFRSSGGTPKRAETPAPKLRFYEGPTDISNITPGRLPRSEYADHVY